VVGTVTDVVTGAPLQGVAVTILGSGTSARTDVFGWYGLRNIATTQVDLRVELPGYVVVVDRFTLTASLTRVNFELEPVGAILEKLIVQGRPQRGDSVVDVTASEPTGLDWSVADALASEPGMVVVRPGPQFGSGVTIQLRGLKSILPGQDPLIYLDGIRVWSGPKQLMAGDQILDDVLSTIPLSEIDSIKVLKGPATAWQYGDGAVNGVILIYTKRR
jgi:iron complex outermembrane receptor protein